MTRDERVTELNRMPKAQLIRTCKAGVRKPGGGLCYIDSGMFPLESWQRDELINSVLQVEYPAAGLEHQGDAAAGYPPEMTR